MRIQFTFEGNGKKILVVTVILVIAIAGMMWWRDGAGTRESARVAERLLEERDAHNQRVRESLFSKPVKAPFEKIINASFPLEDVEKFQKVKNYGPSQNLIGPATETLARLRLAAHGEFEKQTGRLYSDIVHERPLTPQEEDLCERLGRKYAALFREWFDPKWAEIQAAGPGKASWNLKFEAVVVR